MLPTQMLVLEKGYLYCANAKCMLSGLLYYQAAWALPGLHRPPTLRSRRTKKEYPLRDLHVFSGGCRLLTTLYVVFWTRSSSPEGVSAQVRFDAKNTFPSSYLSNSAHYSSSMRGSSGVIESMGCTCTAFITPSRVARMLCSIFIASTTHTSSPAETRSPGRTKMEITHPGMGERRMLSEGRPWLEEIRGGGTAMSAERVRGRGGLVTGWEGSPSTFT